MDDEGNALKPGDLPSDMNNTETVEDTLGSGALGTSIPRRSPRARRRVANPDDPPVRRPRYGRYGPQPAPVDSGAPGRTAIVQGQVYLVGIILVTQLVLVTVALLELLEGRTNRLWWIAGISLVGFIIALVVTFWPRSRVKGF